MKDGARRAGVTCGPSRLREVCPILREFVHVRFEEERSGSIQGLQVFIQEGRRQLAVEEMVRELGVLQQAGGEARDVRIGLMRVGGWRRRVTAKPHRSDKQGQPDAGDGRSSPGREFHETSGT